MLVIELEDICSVILDNLCLTVLTLTWQHESTENSLVAKIQFNTRRYVQLFCEVVDELIPPPTRDISDYDEVIDVILHQRRQRNEQIEGGQERFPDHLLRR